MKIVSDDILHKTEAGGVIVGLATAADVRRAFDRLVKNAKGYKKNASIQGVQVQQMVKGGQEVMVGAVTDPSFGKMIAFGLGGVLVEVMKDITFRLAPVGKKDALSMLDSIGARGGARGVRGGKGVNRAALADIIVKVSKLVNDFPEIQEVDLNPIFATDKGAKRGRRAHRCRRESRKPRQRFSQTRDSRRHAAHHESAFGGGDRRFRRRRQDRQLGDEKSHQRRLSRRDLSDPSESCTEILGRKAYPSVLDVAEEIDVAVFAIPAKFCAAAMDEVGRKKIPGAVMIPSGFAEVGEQALQDELLGVARKHNVRVMGPNIYGFYYTPQNLCATFCTPYDVKGKVALSSQSGGVGMSIIGFSRTTRMGVSAIVGFGNKSDLDEDDLLTYFEQDDNTQVIAMHCEDLKDGRSFAEVASRVSKKKPIVMLKAGRTALGARAAASHTGALAGNDKIYDDVLRQCGVIRAKSLNDMLQFARGLQVLPTPKGENIVIITGAGGSGVLLSDACVDNGLSLMKMPPDMDAAFRKFIPPFGAAGNPVDITGGEPPTTYANTIRYALGEPRIHSLILGYWHTIITPPMVFAKLCAEVVQEARDKGIDKPVVASLVGDVQVEEASEYLYERGIVAYPYTTELPVAVLGAKYKWARGAGVM